jgi:hypothetical protein
LHFFYNFFGLIVFTNTIAGIVISIIVLPLTASIIWGTWFISLIAMLLLAQQLMNAIQARNIPQTRTPLTEIPLQTIVVQQPDGSLNLTIK